MDKVKLEAVCEHGDLPKSTEQTYADVMQMYNINDCGLEL